MHSEFTLIDAPSLGDLRVFLTRAGRVEDGSVRLIAADHVLAVYVAVLYPSGLLDQTPTVLGLRTFALSTRAEFDAVVPVRSLLDRLERAEAGVPVTLPMQVYTVTWAAISPPRGGWVAQKPTDASILNRVAASGIAEVAHAIPTGTGEQIVQRVRAEVWGRAIEGLEHVVAGGAFAALSLGFLGDADAIGEVRLFETGPWTRLTTDRGHVLVKRRAWSLLG